MNLAKKTSDLHDIKKYLTSAVEMCDDPGVGVEIFKALAVVDALLSPLEEKFWGKVNKTEDCWLWTGNCNDSGYGTYHIGDIRGYCHRLSYELARGDIPTGHVIDHKVTCPKNCVNPAHLRPTTTKQNCENLAGPHRDSKSGVRGVVWEESRKKYRVSVGHNNRVYSGGRFFNIIEAEAAAVALRRKLFTHNDVDREAV